MRKALLALFAVLLLLLAACNGNGDTDTGNGEEPADDANGEAEAGDATVGLSLSTLQNPFFVSLRDGAQEAADAAGAELLVSDAQDDAQTQANDIEDFITRGVDVIIVNPVDSAAIVTSIESANSAEIPVLTVDRGADGGDVASHIASDNVLGGRLAGEYLFEQIGGAGQVAQLEGVAGASAARDRGAGFQEALDEAADVELVASQTANFNRDEGLTVAENILQAQGELAGFFAQNDEMALGAVEAASATGRLEDLVIVGFDATDDALTAIEAGEMDATIAQQPSEMGRIAVETAVDVAGGADVEAEQPVEVQLVTADNVGDFTG
jgi:ribose transport system substrate-binding protein